MGSRKNFRVLVVDDEPLIRLDVAATLERAGCQVIGPFGSAAAALDAVQTRAPDAAVLDINLSNETAIPVADALVAAGVPFVWLTGYTSTMLPERHRHRPILGKPALARALLDELGIT